MKTFIDYNSATIWNKIGKPPVLTISISERGQGKIFFSTACVSLLGLKEGVRLSFRVYNHEPDVIYIYPQATGLPLKKVNTCKNGIQLAIFCRPLAKKLLISLGYKDGKSKTFDMTAETVLMPDTNCKAFFVQKDKLHKSIKWR